MIKSNFMRLQAFFLLIGTSCFPSNHLQQVFSENRQKAAIASFIDHVLKQAKSEDVFRVVDAFLSKNCTDQQFYRQLLLKADFIKPQPFFYHQIHALNAQKKVLANQLKILLKDYNNFENCLEIGNPATYLQAASGHFKINGKVYALMSSQSATDVIQAFGFNPTKKFLFYDQFIALQDYLPICDKDIASNSLDLVICTIGLHHVAPERLEGFVASIARTLKPGGVFVLREHDCTTPELFSLAFAAHSIYNAIATSEKLESETQEIRNFRPLQDWIELLARHNLIARPERLLQAGDSTNNTLLAFTKQSDSEQDVLTNLSQNLKKSDAQYERPLVKTYLSSTEWYNVDVAQEYGQFINHTPFYEFPYFKSIATYWDIFGKSWQAAASKKGHLNVLTSDHTLMNLFIGLTMTLEYTAKGVLSWPVRQLFHGEEPSVIKAIIFDPADEISHLSSAIKVLDVNSKFKLKTVELPRYKEFVNLLIRMANTKIIVQEIAGQNQIQFKVKSGLSVPDFNQIDGCKLEYSWNSVSRSQDVISSLSVSLPKMNSVILQLQALGVEILYIHDF